jgi:methylglutaconyl-CoA hydratase
MRVTINREDRRNAMNDSVRASIGDAFSAAVADRRVKAIVLTGAGERAFCAGADLRSDARRFDYESGGGLLFARLLKQARELPVPLIVRVNGHCLAGGIGLLAMADMAVAADHARFGLPEVRVGVFPMQVMSVLQHLIPPRKLYELALTGEPVSAAEAVEMGLVNYAVPAAELDAKVDWLLGRILDKSSSAIRRGKYAMRQAEFMTFEQAIAFLESQIQLLGQTPDAIEGRKAFAEKRPPIWEADQS